MEMKLDEKGKNEVKLFLEASLNKGVEILETTIIKNVENEKVYSIIT